MPRRHGYYRTFRRGLHDPIKGVVTARTGRLRRQPAIAPLPTRTANAEACVWGCGRSNSSLLHHLRERLDRWLDGRDPITTGNYRW